MSDSPIPRREVFCDKAALAVLFLFLIVGFLTVGRYSYTIDEPAVIRRGQASIQFVKNFFVGKGMPNGPDGQAFWSMYHPPLYGMMLAAASHVLEINLGIESIVARHVANILWATVGLWFLFLLGRRLFGSAAGLAALLFMIFFPRFIAHAHYNPKDVPTMVWGVIAVYALVVFQGRPSLKSAVFAGAALGLGVATGLNVLFLLPVAFVAILSVGGVRARMAIVMVLSFVAATVLAWPQLWVRPAHFLNAVHFFSGSEWWPFEVLYFGRTYMAKDLPWHYTVAHVLMTTPVITFLFSMIGAVWLARMPKKTVLVMLLMWLLFPILARSRSGLVRYDEMRHVFLAVPPLVLFAGIGAAMVIERIPRKAAALTLLALFSYQTVDVIRLYPYEGSYYNEAVRLILPRHIEKYFPMAPWGSTCRQTVDWFNGNAEPNAHVCMSCEQSPLWYEFRSDLVIDCQAPDYNSYVTNHNWTKQIARFADQNPLFTESRYGSDLFYIYKSTSTHEKKIRYPS